MSRISAIRIAGRVGFPSRNANTFWEFDSTIGVCIGVGGSNDICSADAIIKVL